MIRLVTYLLLFCSGTALLAQSHTRTVGNKSLELSNHLGNVLEVTTDRKVDKNREAEIVAFNDYYPYGMLMEGRYGQVDTSNYRFGFNGKEFENEHKNEYNFGERIYNVRLARWNRLDGNPKAFQSNYAFAKGNPQIFIDTDGNDDYYYSQGGQLIQTVVTGTAPRFFQVQVETFRMDDGGVGLIIPMGTKGVKKFTPTADYIVRRHFNNLEKIQAIRDDYTRAGNSAFGREITHDWAATLINNAHHKHHLVRNIVAVAIIAPFAAHVVSEALVLYGPVVASELALMSESGPVIWQGTKSIVAANAIGGTANATYEVGSAAISTGDIGNTNMTSVFTGYTNGPLWSAIFSNFAPITPNDGLSTPSSTSDLIDRTKGCITSYGIGRATDGVMGPIKDEIGNSIIINDESGESIFKFFEYSVESVQNILNDGIKEVTTDKEEKE